MTRHRAFSLYFSVILFVFVSFLLGLMIGKSSVEPVAEEPEVSPFVPVKDLDETPLDFYEELTKPAEEAEPEIILKKEPEASAVESETEEKDLPGIEKAATLTIQVAAYSSREEAERLITRLSAKGFYGRIREPDVASGDKYFRVWVGEYASTGEAEAQARLLKEEGFHTYIRKTL